MGYSKAVSDRVILLKEERVSIPFFLKACHLTSIILLQVINKIKKKQNMN
jgi:hypothetical protein